MEDTNHEALVKMTRPAGAGGRFCLLAQLTLGKHGVPGFRKAPLAGKAGLHRAGE